MFMPELPEVQTVVSQLAKKIVGKRFSGFSSAWTKQVTPAPRALAKKISEAMVTGTRRFGKHIVIDLDNGYSFVIHLKMTGHLLYKTNKNRGDKIFTEDRVNGYIHHIFTFSDGATLEFSDMRKFGWVRLEKTAGVENLKSIRELGIDALSSELTPERFRILFEQRKTRPIAVVLLEQGVIAGVGNIYRSEALFVAGVRPERIVGSIQKKEWSAILSALKKVLRQATRSRGTTDGDFRDTDGRPGSFQRTLFVYARHGQPCKKCGTIIKREKLGQRSVSFCSSCQH